MKSSSEKWSLFSPRQRRALVIVLALLLANWVYQAYRNPVVIEYPQTGPGIHADELEDRIDPNTASSAELAALPAIGPRVAGQIVAYRVRYRRDNRSGAAFKNANDLLKVSGVGFNTLQELEPYLKFPAVATTTSVK